MGNEMTLSHNIQCHSTAIWLNEIFVQICKLMELSRVAIKFGRAIHGAQRMNPFDFGEPLTFCCATSRSKFALIL